MRKRTCDCHRIIFLLFVVVVGIHQDLRNADEANEAEEKFDSETMGSLVACVAFFENVYKQNMQTFNWFDLV